MSLHTRMYMTALLLAIASHSPAQLQSTQSESKEGAAQMTQRANGTFDVKITPQHEDKREGAVLGRMSLHKVFQGGMDGTSEGEMLTAMSSVEGSAVYVAVERFSGTIQGKRGTVALSHRGTMNRGAQELSIEIVPDSGTGELAGIAGSMMIKIENGKHYYELSYRI